MDRRARARAGPANDMDGTRENIVSGKLAAENFGARKPPIEISDPVEGAGLWRRHPGWVLRKLHVTVPRHQLGHSLDEVTPFILCCPLHFPRRTTPRHATQWWGARSRGDGGQQGEGAGLTAGAPWARHGNPNEGPWGQPVLAKQIRVGAGTPDWHIASRVGGGVHRLLDRQTSKNHNCAKMRVARAVHKGGERKADGEISKQHWGGLHVSNGSHTCQDPSYLGDVPSCIRSVAQGRGCGVRGWMWQLHSKDKWYCIDSWWVGVAEGRDVRNLQHVTSIQVRFSDHRGGHQMGPRGGKCCRVVRGGRHCMDGFLQRSIHYMYMQEQTPDACLAHGVHGEMHREGKMLRVGRSCLPRVVGNAPPPWGGDAQPPPCGRLSFRLPLSSLYRFNQSCTPTWRWSTRTRRRTSRRRGSVQRCSQTGLLLSGQRGERGPRKTYWHCPHLPLRAAGIRTTTTTTSSPGGGYATVTRAVLPAPAKCAVFLSQESTFLDGGHQDGGRIVAACSATHSATHAGESTIVRHLCFRGLWADPYFNYRTPKNKKNRMISVLFGLPSQQQEAQD
eukprot:gene8583-biopygen18138